MGLHVKLELLVDEHYNNREKLGKGDQFSTDPNRAQRLIDAGYAKKVGVVDPDADNEPTHDVVEEEAPDDEPVEGED